MNVAARTDDAALDRHSPSGPFQGDAGCARKVTGQTDGSIDTQHELVATRNLDLVGTARGPINRTRSTRPRGPIRVTVSSVEYCPG